MINFNKPYFTGQETAYIKQAVESTKISGDGIFTHKCQQFFESRYAFKKCLLTTSCTDALEMAAILLNIQPGDEVIVPSYTFVSTANAFALRGAKIVFADSMASHPNMDAQRVESLITPRTKAIVVVHYAGVACQMDELLDLVKRHNIHLVEDAAQAVDSYYKEKPLGSFGCMSTFSFHETKNIISGEGGMLVINDENLIERAEIIREKGTNRSKFFRGEVDKYNWVDLGSSFLPSDIIAAYLYAQLENIDDIQNKRKHVWQMYYNHLAPLQASGNVRLAAVPDWATNNAHMFYLTVTDTAQRDRLLAYLKENGVYAVFHYMCLHKSPFIRQSETPAVLPNAEFFEANLLRLPFYYELQDSQIEFICDTVKRFFDEV